MGLAIGHFDGGSSNNPGLAAWAFALKYKDAPVALSGRLGITTNNVAEYRGLISLLEYALEHGVRRLLVKGDSALVVEQVKGNWKVKDADLKPLAARAKELAVKFELFELVWIPRDQNSQCDEMVKAEIEAQKKRG
jgi:probable phosphoglycerate mutase